MQSPRGGVVVLQPARSSGKSAAAFSSGGAAPGAAVSMMLPQHVVPRPRPRPRPRSLLIGRPRSLVVVESRPRSLVLEPAHSPPAPPEAPAPAPPTQDAEGARRSSVPGDFLLSQRAAPRGGHVDELPIIAQPTRWWKPHLPAPWFHARNPQVLVRFVSPQSLASFTTCVRFVSRELVSITNGPLNRTSPTCALVTPGDFSYGRSVHGVRLWACSICATLLERDVPSRASQIEHARSRAGSDGHVTEGATNTA